MELKVIRDVKTPEFTLGKFYINGMQTYFTCEDAIHTVKIAGQTAIPVGRYKILVTASQRFGRPMPQLMNVSNFTGIRIHSGNTAANTEGCILIGMQRIPNGVGISHEAFDDFFPKLLNGLKDGEVFITVE